MKTTINEEAGKIKVALNGELDTVASREAEKDFDTLMNAHDKEIDIDCSQLNYISSSGLRLFLSLLKKCKANNSTLNLLNMNDNIKKVFSMTGFSSLFNIG